MIFATTTVRLTVRFAKRNNFARILAGLFSTYMFLVHPGNKSVGLTAEELGSYDADIILVAPCGFDRKRAASDGEKMWRHAWWRELRAVKEGKVRCCHVVVLTV